MKTLRSVSFDSNNSTFSIIIYTRNVSIGNNNSNISIVSNNGKICINCNTCNVSIVILVVFPLFCLLLNQTK